MGSYNFNHRTGFYGIFLGCIAMSLFFFSAAYLTEGLGWLDAYDDEKNELYLDVGWNWIRGSGVAFLITVGLGVASRILLSKNKRLSNDLAGKPVLPTYNFNTKLGLWSLILFSVSLVFVFHGAFYRIEAVRWLNAGLGPGEPWFVGEALAWYQSSAVMFAIAIILLVGTGALAWKNWKGK